MTKYEGAHFLYGYGRFVVTTDSSFLEESSYKELVKTYAIRVVTRNRKNTVTDLVLVLLISAFYYAGPEARPWYVTGGAQGATLPYAYTSLSRLFSRGVLSMSKS